MNIILGKCGDDSMEEKNAVKEENKELPMEFPNLKKNTSGFLKSSCARQKSCIPTKYECFPIS